MKRLLSAAAIAVAALVARPGEAQAYWGSPQCWQGFPWLQGKALNCMPWIHYNGPLFSYGPYNVPGYVDMYVKNPHCGAYIPAYAPGYAVEAAPVAAPAPPAAAAAPAPEVIYGDRRFFKGRLRH